jgi:hypothetical protein
MELPRDWGSSCDSRSGAGIGVEQLSEAGTELAVEDDLGAKMVAGAVVTAGG